MVEALQARDPSALTAVYDAYGDRIYAYCWFQWRNRDAAGQALRDTLIVAEAHIGRLRDADRFGPWLYAIARHECARSMPYGGRRPDVSIATHRQDDVDLRVTAWRAVMSLAPLSREAMELHIRHRLELPDLGAVLGLLEEDVTALLDRARVELEAALTAELLAHDGPYDCRVRADLLRERRDELSADLRARLLRHALTCRVCGPHRPRNVSPAKVYELLPTVTPPESLRRQVLDCFHDTDLTGYRCAVAAQIADFDERGFPVQQPRTPPARRAAVEETADDGRGPLSRHPLILGAVAALLVGASMGGASVAQFLCRSDDRPAAVTAPGGTSAPPRLSGFPAPPIAGAGVVGDEGTVVVPQPGPLAIDTGSAVPQPMTMASPPPDGRIRPGEPMPPLQPPPGWPTQPPMSPPPTGGPPRPTPPPPTRTPPATPPPTQTPPGTSPPTQTPPTQTPPPTQAPPTQTPPTQTRPTQPPPAQTPPPTSVPPTKPPSPPSARPVPRPISVPPSHPTGGPRPVERAR
ncbi:hypothetical protein GCM10009780_73850 [Actinomadura alba]